jgi:predicted outer membrane repeat protein
MSQRQRRRKAERRSQAQRRVPSRRQVAAGATVAMGATLAATGNAQAATFNVTNLNDDGAGSLRQAILDANASPGMDQVLFQATLSGRIALGSDLDIYGPTEVRGPGPDKLTISGNNSSRIFYVLTTAQAPVTISGLTLTGGSAVGGGGAIFSKYATLTVADAVISQNSTLSAGSSDAGGGIFNRDGALTIRSSTISGNSAGESGGGIYSLHDSPSSGLTIESSTITGNSAAGGGGGAALYEFAPATGASLRIRNTTISGNSAEGAGGGLVTYAGASRTMVNTIVADNSASSGPDITVFGAVGTPFNASFSLVENPSLANLTGSPNITGQDPRLLPLADNGGPAPTQAPGVGSPVIDKGASFGLTSDQRGVQRPIDFPAIPNAAGGDGSDIGAFELQPDNAFKLGKLKRNKKKGTAKLVVILPVPDAGSVTIQGKGMKTKTGSAADTGMLKLPVIPKGKKRKQENRTGKVKIKAKITYNAIGNAATTLTRKLKLKKKI